MPEHIVSSNLLVVPESERPLAIGDVPPWARMTRKLAHAMQQGRTSLNNSSMYLPYRYFCAH